MKVYLSLGSNLGDRRNHLSKAVHLLKQAGLRNVRTSPIVESPALLPVGALSQWNKPYLNLVLIGDVDDEPAQWLVKTKAIQDKLGRKKASRWSPRTMDIDILMWGDCAISTPELNIPHAELHKRAFVLSPLLHLEPGLRLPLAVDKSVLQWTRKVQNHIPLWMGILNVTPDSFSDGGHNSSVRSIKVAVKQMIECGVHIVDIGAESTRPGATSLTAEEEWSRLQPVLTQIKEIIADIDFPPLVSVDTYHVVVAEKSLQWGVDIINDVSGLRDPDMIALARDSDIDWVAMHNLGVPANSATVLAEGCDPCVEVRGWIEQKMDDWANAGVDLNHIIFDPGIGFGKTSLQSLKLLRHIKYFNDIGLRLLVGHSRKSFMTSFGDLHASERDVETIGASLSLCAQGVDVIRVHDVESHQRAFLAWSHLECYRDIEIIDDK